MLLNETVPTASPDEALPVSAFQNTVSCQLDSCILCVELWLVWLLLLNETVPTASLDEALPVCVPEHCYL